MGIVFAAQSIYATAGWQAFTRGWMARLLFTAPAGAISWSVYEFFKHFLHNYGTVLQANTEETPPWADARRTGHQANLRQVVPTVHYATALEEAPAAVTNV